MDYAVWPVLVPVVISETQLLNKTLSVLQFDCAFHFAHDFLIICISICRVSPQEMRIIHASYMF
jgi:hypothetical protein